MKKLAHKIVGLALVAACCSCAIVQSVVDLTACITDHAVHGDSLAKIAEGCATDVPPVVTAIIQSTDPKVKASRAYAECETLWKVVDARPKTDDKKW